MKHRLERVAEVLKREVSMAIQREITFTGALVTVSAVEVTPDLRHAYVHVSMIGNPGQKREALGMLEQNRALLQHETAKRVILKFTPQLHFKLDESIERGSRVIELLDKLADEEETRE